MARLRVNILSDGDGHDVVLIDVEGWEEMVLQMRRHAIGTAVALVVLVATIIAVLIAYGAPWWIGLGVGAATGMGAFAGVVTGMGAGEVSTYRSLANASADVRVRYRDPCSDPDAPPQED